MPKESPTLVGVSASSINRGPSHSFLNLLLSQMQVRRVVLLTPPGFLADEARHHGIDVHEVLAPRRSTSRRSSRLKTIPQMSDIIRREIAPGSSIVANSVGAALRVCLVARRLAMPLYCIFRSEYISRGDVLRFRSLVKAAPDVRLLAVSPYSQGLLYGAQASGQLSVRVLPNIVEHRFFEPAIADRCAWLGTELLPRTLKVAYVGSATRRKGFDVLVETFRHLRDSPVKFSLILVGPSEEEASRRFPAVDRLTTFPQVDGVSFTGRLPSVAEPLRDADIVFLPAPMESFGRPVIEAAAAGVPIVCSRNPGHDCIVRDGFTANTFEPGRPDLAAQAMLRCVQERDETRHYRDAAYRLARTFSSEHVGTQFDAMLNESAVPPESKYRWQSGNVQPGNPITNGKHFA